MSALEEADKAVKEFLDEYDICATCEYWTPELIGGVCNAPEYPIGHLEDDTMTCEQHEFKDKELEKQCNALSDKWYNAWQIVEGFLYGDLPEGIL